MKILSIDIETTGLDPQKCQILSLAAVIDDTVKLVGHPVDDLPYYTRIIRPLRNKISGDIHAINMNRDIINILATTPEKDDPENPNQPMSHLNFARYFIKWLAANISIEQEKINIAGKNFAMFDKDFLERFEVAYPILREFKWNRRILDPAILYWQSEDVSLPDTPTCMKRANFPVGKEHDALTDARNVIRLLRKGMNYSDRF